MCQARRIDLKENIWSDERGWGTNPIQAAGVQRDLLGSVHKEIINENEPALFEIPPNVEHTILNNSRDNIYLMAFSDSDERDTIRSIFA